MKCSRKCALRDYMSECFDKARNEDSFLANSFFERYKACGGTCPDFEQTQGFCCTLAFVAYLCFFCEDANALVRDLREMILRTREDERRMR